MNKSILALLLEGAYICPVRYLEEFNILQDEDEQARVNEWLSQLNKRLARLGTEGAFFMAHAFIGNAEIKAIKDEFIKFRDVYGPAVQMLDFIRQTDPSQFSLTPGDFVAPYQLEAMVTASSTLEKQLRDMVQVITNSALSQSNHVILRKLLEHLAKDGYLVLANKESDTYQVTGKIDQLFAVLQYLDENHVIPDAMVDESDLQDADLIEMAALDDAGDQASSDEGQAT